MKKTFFILIYMLTGSFLWAQEEVSPPSVVPPSPDVASLGKYGEIPVGNYTGIPNINIPIYQIKDRDLPHMIRGKIKGTCKHSESRN